MRRIAVLVVAAGILAPVISLPRAGEAASTTVPCAALQAALDAAQSGDVITLQGVCTGNSFRLPAGVQITLQGDGADGADGFDGTGLTERVLSGGDVLTTTIRSLVFRNGTSSGDGGALALTGTSSPRILDSQFYNNQAASSGGAVYVQSRGVDQTVISGNTFGSLQGLLLTNTAQTREGGAFFVVGYDIDVSGNSVTGNRAQWAGQSCSPFGVEGKGGGGFVAAFNALTASDNVFRANTASCAGGGLFIEVFGDTTLVGNAFVENEVEGECCSAVGGGLAVLEASFNVIAGPAQVQPAAVTQQGNSFDENRVGSAIDGDSLGGGEWVLGLDVSSRDDRFVNNAVEGFPEGGGLAVQSSFRDVTFHGENLVAAGNVALGGFGGGIYTGQVQSATHLELLNSTVAGNTAGEIGFPNADGIGGDPEDSLDVTNTIVIGNSPSLTDEIAGFGSVTATFSDLCDPSAPPAPFPGAGNICADPLLVDPSPGVADVHQTPGSPTIDLGSNALVPPALTNDYEGEPRVRDGDGDGAPVVDMGADEAPGSGDVSITKSDSPDPVDLGAQITYDLAVTNLGVDPSLGVVVVDTLPAGVTFVSAASSEGACTQTGPTVTCPLGTMAPAAVATATIVVTASAAGTITNTAVVSADTPDPNPANNTALAATTVLGPEGPGPTCPGPTWYLAEGSTREGFDEYLLMLNPSGTAATVEVLYIVEGDADVTRSYTIAAQRRLTVPVFEAANLGRGRDHGTVVKADRAILVERSVYVKTDIAGLSVNGDHNAIAVAAPRPAWYFSEGTSLLGFQTYFAVSNPTLTATVVTATYGIEGGGSATVSRELPALSRLTLDANSVADGVGSGIVGFSTVISATVPVVAERSVYFDHDFLFEGGEAHVRGATDTFGVSPSTAWYLAEGNVLPDFTEFLTLGNFAAGPSIVTINYLLENAASVAKTVTVPARSRVTIPVHDAAAPGGLGRTASDPVSRGVGVAIVATGEVVVERVMYFSRVIDPGIGPVVDGHATAGYPGFERIWYFAEGSGLLDFRTFLTLSNPQAAAANVTVSYFPDDASGVVSKTFIVPAGQRRTVQTYNASDPGGYGVPAAGFSIKVVSDQRILAERPEYEVHEFPDIGLVNGGNASIGLPDQCAAVFA